MSYRYISSFFITSLLVLFLLTCQKDETVPLNQFSITDEHVTASATKADIKTYYVYVSGKNCALNHVNLYYCKDEGMSNPLRAQCELKSDNGGTYLQVNISGLEALTTYYYYYEVANAINSMKTEKENFATNDYGTPSVTTVSVTNITGIGANFNGRVDDGGELNVTERGFCYGTSAGSLSVSGQHVAAGSGLGSFSKAVSGLSASTTYYMRAYARNNKGVAYGSVKSFTTTNGMPVVTTNNVTNIGVSSATCGGNVTSDGGYTVNARGVCWSTSQNPTINNNHTTNGSGTGSFTATLTGLSANTTYYVRAYATNSQGTSYGAQKTFTTVSGTPTVVTASVSSITDNSAIGGGNVTSAGASAVTARGVCWSTSSNPTIGYSHTTNGSGTGAFSASMTGLASGTTYYVRAYATNSYGTSYGSQVSFTTTGSTSCPGAATVTDIDGNVYNTMLIGTQCWMKQNLRTTHYANGTAISYGGDNISTSTAYRYYPSGNSSYVSTYGYLYNWAAVMHGSSSSSSSPSGVQGICPTGWHVPSSSEWSTMLGYVGSQSVYQCGGSSSNYAKAIASTTGWWSSSVSCAIGNTMSSNNATGFTMMPAGYNIYGPGKFGQQAIFWTSTAVGTDHAWMEIFSYDNSTVTFEGRMKEYAVSVRCVRN